MSKAVSASSRPQADIRAWDNLPHSLFLTGLQCPPGTVKISVQALDGAGNAVSASTKTVAVPPSGPPTLLWLEFP